MMEQAASYLFTSSGGQAPVRVMLRHRLMAPDIPQFIIRPRQADM